MSQLNNKRRTLNILLVEDNQTDIDITLRAFKKAELKNNLFFVSDGEEAVNYILRKGEFNDGEKYPKPDLILLDINLPKLNGFQVLEKIKAEEKFRMIPVIMLTSSNNEDDINKCYSLGCAGYIQKPINYERFLEMINLFNIFWQEICLLPNE